MIIKVVREDRSFECIKLTTIYYDCIKEERREWQIPVHIHYTYAAKFTNKM